MPGNVRKEMQMSVDQYLTLYHEYKQLKEQLDALRELIEPYMRDNGFGYIEASDGHAKVELTKQERTPQTSRYSAYDVQEIAGLLTPALRKKCIVEVVDKDKLEALCKLGEIPGEVLERKQTKPGYTFAVRMIK